MAVKKDNGVEKGIGDVKYNQAISKLGKSMDENITLDTKTIKLISTALNILNKKLIIHCRQNQGRNKGASEVDTAENAVSDVFIGSTIDHAKAEMRKTMAKYQCDLIDLNVMRREKQQMEKNLKKLKRTQGFAKALPGMIRQTYPDATINTKAKLSMSTALDKLVTRILEKLKENVGEHGDVGEEDLKTAMEAVIPGTMAHHAHSEGTKLVCLYETGMIGSTAPRRATPRKKRGKPKKRQKSASGTRKARRRSVSAAAQSGEKSMRPESASVAPKKKSKSRRRAKSSDVVGKQKPRKKSAKRSSTMPPKSPAKRKSRKKSPKRARPSSAKASVKRKSRKKSPKRARPASAKAPVKRKSRKKKPKAIRAPSAKASVKRKSRKKSPKRGQPSPPKALAKRKSRKKGSKRARGESPKAEIKRKSRSKSRKRARVKSPKVSASPKPSKQVVPVKDAKGKPRGRSRKKRVSKAPKRKPLSKSRKRRSPKPKSIPRKKSPKRKPKKRAISVGPSDEAPQKKSPKRKTPTKKRALSVVSSDEEEKKPKKRATSKPTPKRKSRKPPKKRQASTPDSAPEEKKRKVSASKDLLKDLTGGEFRICLREMGNAMDCNILPDGLRAIGTNLALLAKAIMESIPKSVQEIDISHMHDAMMQVLPEALAQHANAYTTQTLMHSTGS